MQKGWIKIHRSLAENWVFNYGPKSYGEAWLDLLMAANHTEGHTCISGTMVVVHRGQRLTSILKLSKQWQRGRKWTAKFLDNLEKEHMITQKRNTRFTLITICNYDKFQGDSDGAGTAKEQLREQQKNNRRTAEGTTEEHNIRIKECKEGKECKKVKEIKDPSRVSAVEVFDYWREVMKTPRSQLGKERKRLIKERLQEGYSVEDLKLAVDGCAKTPWNMGINPSEKEYKDIALICRSASNIDRFIGNFTQPPRVGEGKSAAQSAAEAQETGRFIEKTLGINVDNNNDNKTITSRDVWPCVEIDSGIDGGEGQ